MSWRKLKSTASITYLNLLVVVVVKSGLCNKQEQQQQLLNSNGTTTRNRIVEAVSQDSQNCPHSNPHWKQLGTPKSKSVLRSSNCGSTFTRLKRKSNVNQPFAPSKAKRNEPSTFPAHYELQVLHTKPWSTPEPPLFGYEKPQKRYSKGLYTPRSSNDQSIDNIRSKKSIIRRSGRQADDDVDVDNEAATSKGDSNLDGHLNRDPAKIRETRSFHDIYMRVAGPSGRRNLFGHVEHGPNLHERRIESQRRGNRFRGEVLWADKSGSYGAHFWDLAQGKL